MAHQESEEYAENTVMAEFQRGYFLNDKLLRPARVVVSRGADEEKCEEDEE
jgi:molecular chaperone GrpE